jgi:hypothetical protein
MAMSLPDAFDPTRAVTAETVDGLTMPELMQRLQRLNTEIGTVHASTNLVARIPSVRGILAVLDSGKGQTSELGIILESIQRRANQISGEIDTLKNEV